jgi:hypothetical protein
MNAQEPTSTSDRASDGLLGRVVGIVVSPIETMRRVVATPRWLGVLALTSVVNAVFVGGFLSTEVGQEAWLDEAIESTRSIGGGESDAQLEQMEKIKPYVGAIAAVQSLFMIPLMQLVIAGVLFLVFTVVLGASAAFRELFAVVAHAGVISVVAQFFVWPLNYFRGEMSSPTTFAAFLPMLDADTLLFHVLGMVDLFYIWWVIVLALGLGVLYRRSNKAITISLLVGYAVVAMGIGAIRWSFLG